MRARPTCMQRSRNPTSIAWASSRWWTAISAGECSHEPPDAEPHVRWCGRTAGVSPPPTRLHVFFLRSFAFDGSHFATTFAGVTRCSNRPRCVSFWQRWSALLHSWLVLVELATNVTITVGECLPAYSVKCAFLFEISSCTLDATKQLLLGCSL